MRLCVRGRGNLMNLIIYEGFGDIELEKLSRTFDKKQFALIDIQNFDGENLDKFEKIIILAQEVYTFLSTQVQEFLVKYAENRVIELAVVKAKVDETTLIQSWLNSVCVKDGKNIKFITSINYENLDEGLQNLFNLSQRKLENADKVVIYTDGACSYNPGPGGWAAYIMYGSKTKKLSGFEEETTNNRMELMAIIQGLSALNRPCRVELYSDSAYVVNGMKQDWLTNWKANKWKNSDNKPVKNQELWMELDRLVSYHEIEFFKVKGHADNEFNNLVDKMATDEIAKHVNIINSQQKDEDDKIKKD